MRSMVVVVGLTVEGSGCGGGVVGNGGGEGEAALECDRAQYDGSEDVHDERVCILGV